MLSSIMKMLSAILSIYTLIIIVRIMMSWFHGPGGGDRTLGFLSRITDPYLDYFRRFPFLRIGNLDFSPVAALIVLSVAGNILNSVAAFGRVTLGLVLALIVAALWSAAAFFLGLFLVLIVIRALGLILRINSASPFWRTLDMMLNPVLFPITDKVLGGRRGSYMSGLFTGGAVLLAMRIFGGFVVHRLVILLQKLPF